MTTSPPDDLPLVEVAAATPAETLALGRRLASLLRRGDVVLLVGPLGAGKTLLAGGIAEGLGVEDPVISPTFVIARSYEGFMPVHHADIYRLSSLAEFDDLELPERAEDGVLLIEWGNAVSALVPPDHLVVELIIAEGDTRNIRFTPRGTWRNRSLWDLVA
jgi:tRNA threonylcarbamoyladenosine biosynthesis protein TsaE